MGLQVQGVGHRGFQGDHGVFFSVAVIRIPIHIFACRPGFRGACIVNLYACGIMGTLTGELGRLEW